jgi:formylglycine-generating enzyme required for sulfatase activity
MVILPESALVDIHHGADRLEITGGHKLQTAKLPTAWITCLILCSILAGCPKDSAPGPDGGDPGNQTQRSITITDPAADAANLSYPGGSTLAIRWTSTGEIANVRIELLYDPSASGDPGQAHVVDTVIADLTPNDGAYDWVTPALNEMVADYFIRVSNADDAGVFGVSCELILGSGRPSAPDKASDPNPSNEAVDVSVESDLDWKDTALATSYDVYFGTSALPPSAGHTTSSEWTLAPLSHGTTYYWSVVASNSAGSTPGPVWSFTTQPDAPGTPGEPTPADGGVDVPVESDLDWTDAAWVTSYDVYFGTSNPPPLVGNTDSSNWTLATLSHGTTYYWSIVASSSAGLTPGPVWSFTTQPGVPDVPSGPTPHDGAVEVPVEAGLDWSDAAWAASYGVYFGTSDPPPLAGSTTSSNWTPATLSHGTTYFWSIVAGNSVASTAGPVWSFTTQPDMPVEPSNPTPNDGALYVATDLGLDWSDATWATSYDVYFGTSDPPPFVGNSAYSDWWPGELSHGTTYYWRVIATNSAGSTSGPVWSFATGADPAGGMAFIPAGEFQMGDAFNEGTSAELPVHAVFVNAFYIDVCEVTNQQYAAALNWALDHGLVAISGGLVYQAGSDNLYCQTTISSSLSRITWDGSTFGVLAGKENHPMALASWYGAAAYCNWRSAMDGRPLCYDLSTWECNFNTGGYRLPTEAEWEKAARGGAEGHRYPWTDEETIQQTRASYWSSPSFPYDTNPTPGDSPIWGVPPKPYTSPVGFFTGALQYQEDWGWPGAAATYQTANGANGYGLYDMAGNVWEWVNDWYSNPYYDVTPYENPHGPDSGTYRVMRGGSWDDSAYGCRVANRGLNEPGDPDTDDGFRCALTP